VAVEAVSGPSVTWRRPDRKLLLLRRLEVGAVAVAAALVGGVWLGLRVGPAAGLVCAAAVAAVGAVCERILARRFSSWGYAEREDDLLVQRGVLVYRLSVVPYGRMQFIDVRAGPLERSFGLATVHMHTAAAASDARIPGLARDEAARLRDRLAELGEAEAAGL
jgi:membrane protein YdbS with pleckstrin-like domain